MDHNQLVLHNDTGSMARFRSFKTAEGNVSLITTCRDMQSILRASS